MAAGYPASSNTYVPSHEASGGLIVAFSRNIKDFKLNQYIKLVPVSKSAGYYLQITAEEAARVINANLQDFVWADGAEAPMGNQNLESFQYVKFLTQRFATPFNLGQKAVNQADWPILQVHAGISAAKMMTIRTQNVWNQLTTSGNWAGNTGTATALGGGLWDVSGATDKFIRKSFNQVAENIIQATLGVVQRKDLVCVINPHTARLMSETEELRDVLKQSPYALGIIRGDDKETGNWESWMLPPTLFGIKVVVEDAVKVTSKKGATSKTTSYVLPNQTAVFLARPGGLVGMEGIPEFSTAQVFCYEEMTVESKVDVDNRRTLGRCVDDVATAVVAPAAGYYVTSCTS